MIVKITTKALLSGAYSQHQERLYGRVSSLRDREQLTFAAIAKILTKSGTRSARGCLLAAEHVYSIYKKGKLRELRIDEGPVIINVWCKLKGKNLLESQSVRNLKKVM